MLSGKIQPKLLKAVRLHNSIITKTIITTIMKMSSVLGNFYPLDWNAGNDLILQSRTLRQRRNTGLNDLLKVRYVSSFDPKK